MFKVTYRPMWPGVLFTCLFIQMFVLLVTQVTIIKDYLLTCKYGTQVYSNDPEHMTKMAAMPIYGKKSLSIFFSTTLI